MKLKVFSFRFSESGGGFDDGPMQEFIADKEVIEYSEHFFVHEKTPYLVVLLSYREMSSREKRRSSRSADPRKELDDREKKVYDALRTWRAARSRQEGIPPYMIATNRQLAEMVRIKAQTKADLAEISGIGEAKISQYGPDMLKTLAGQPAPDEPGKQKAAKETKP